MRRSGRAVGSPQVIADQGIPAAWTVIRSPAVGADNAFATDAGSVASMMAATLARAASRDAGNVAG